MYEFKIKIMVDSTGKEKLEGLGRLKEEVFIQTRDIDCLCVKAMSLIESMVKTWGLVCSREKERG